MLTSLTSWNIIPPTTLLFSFLKASILTGVTNKSNAEGIIERIVFSKCVVKSNERRHGST